MYLVVSASLSWRRITSCPCAGSVFEFRWAPCVHPHQLAFSCFRRYLSDCFQLKANVEARPASRFLDPFEPNMEDAVEFASVCEQSLDVHSSNRFVQQLLARQTHAVVSFSRYSLVFCLSSGRPSRPSFLLQGLSCGSVYSSILAANECGSLGWGSYEACPSCVPVLAPFALSLLWPHLPPKHNCSR